MLEPDDPSRGEGRIEDAALRRRCFEFARRIRQQRFRAARSCRAPTRTAEFAPREANKKKRGAAEATPRETIRRSPWDHQEISIVLEVLNVNGGQKAAAALR